MAEEKKITFICPACGEAELPLPEGWNPQASAYVDLAEVHDCEQAKRAVFLYGDGHTRGFGGVVRDTDAEGAARERWVPPRAIIAYHHSRQDERTGRSEAASSCYPQPLYRNLVSANGVENVFVAMTFLPHGETLTPGMRARGEAMAKALK